MKKSHITTVVKIIFAAGLFVFVLSQTTLNTLIETIQEVSAAWLIVGVAGFLAVAVIHTWRVWLLFQGTIGFRQLFYITCLSSGISNFAATALGIFSFIALLRLYHNIRTDAGVAAVFAYKLGDTAAVGLFLGLSGWMVLHDVPDLQWLVFALVIASGMICLVAILTVVKKNTIAQMLCRLLECLNLSRHPWGSRLCGTLNEISHFETGRAFRLMIPMMGISVLLAIVQTLWAYAMARAFNIPIGFWPVALTTGVTQMLSWLPIHIFGGLGINDVTKLYLFGCFGFDHAVLAPAIINSRVVFYGLHAVMVGFIILFGWRRVYPEKVTDCIRKIRQNT